MPRKPPRQATPKPCPFCGAKAVVSRNVKVIDGRTREVFAVYCEKRFSQPSERCPVNCRSRYVPTVWQAVRLWNTRKG